MRGGTKIGHFEPISRRISETVRVGPKWFFCNFRLQHTLQQWIATKWMEIDQDNLRTRIAISCRASHELFSNYLIILGLGLCTFRKAVVRLAMRFMHAWKWSYAYCLTVWSQSICAACRVCLLSRSLSCTRATRQYFRQLLCRKSVSMPRL